MSATAVAPVAFMDEQWWLSPKQELLREGAVPNHQPRSPACSMEWKVEWAEGGGGLRSSEPSSLDME